MYQEIYSIYEELKVLLERKKEALKSRNLDELSKVDEECLEVNEKFKKYDLKNVLNSFNDEQKANLKTLANEIKILQEHNEMLINHSLGVINNTLAGIINIVQSDSTSYNAQGKTQGDKDGLNISSITEEA